MQEGLVFFWFGVIDFWLFQLRTSESNVSSLREPAACAGGQIINTEENTLADPLSTPFAKPSNLLMQNHQLKQIQRKPAYHLRHGDTGTTRSNYKRCIIGCCVPVELC